MLVIISCFNEACDMLNFLHRFRLRKDGWLLYPFRDSKGDEIPVINRIQNYCVDGAQAYGELTEYINEEEQTVLFLCSGGVDEGKKITKKRKRKKNKKKKHSSTPFIMRTDFVRTNETDVIKNSENSAEMNVLSRTNFASSSSSINNVVVVPKSTTTAFAEPTSVITRMTSPSTTSTIVPISPTISTTLSTTTTTKATTTKPTTTSRTTIRPRVTTTITTTPTAPIIKTQAQERKVFTLFSSSRNRSFYNKIMSGSNNQVSQDTSTIPPIESMSATTKKSRFRKRSRHYIFYKPISVHSLLRASNGDYYTT